MKTKIVMIICCCSIIVVSCRKQIQSPAPFPANAFSPYQLKVQAITKEVAKILERVYEDDKAVKEVNAAIYSGYYEDERVLLKDLLFTKSSGLYHSEAFKKQAKDTGCFRKRFCELIVKSNDYPLLAAELIPALFRKSAANSQSAVLLDTVPSVLSPTMPLSIYFPYSENFGSAQAYDSLPPNSKLAIMLKPTLVYTDRDDDVAPGKKPYYCVNGSTNLCYMDVTVNDAYAEIRPTHIVAVGAVVQSTPSTQVLKTDLVTRVYNGWSRLTKQMDKLVSFTGNGGGSEIKICRVNGYLKMSDDQVNDFAGDVVTAHFTRADIRKKRFKRIYSVWDPNWNYQDIEQIYAVYEDDTRGTATINGSLTTTVTLPGKVGKAEGEIGFKIAITTQDEIVCQRKIDRKSYLRDGLNNQGFGFVTDAEDFLPSTQDWPIFDGGAVWSYTLPYRIY